MISCLNKNDFDEFLDLHLNDLSIDQLDSGDLKALLESCFNWESEIGLLTYYLTYYLKRKSNLGSPLNNNQINSYYDLSQCGLFNIETFDRGFIEYLSNYSRSKINENLPDTLILILHNYLDRTYDSSFCI